MTEAARASFGALSDIRIIDLTQMLAGPYGTMMLADHGADVIKVEPLTGDMTRLGNQFHREDNTRALGGYFQSVDRNKRSVCLDLKHPEGKAALLALVRDADAIVENFRAGVMDRLGLSYETLQAVNPRLVYGTLRGFGDRRTGASPYVDWPAFDVVAQAMGGIMAITGPDARTPTKIGPGIGDIVPGMMLGFGVLAAIHHARRTGEGQFVDVSMVDSILAICERMVWQNSVEELVPGPEGNHHPFLCPFGMFPASDGFVTFAAQADEFFTIMVDELGMEDVKTDSRFASFDGRTTYREALIPLISRYSARFTKQEMMDRLGGRIPFAPVMNIAEIRQNPHFKAREMLAEVEQPGAKPIVIAGVPIKMTKTPGGVRRRSPLLGEDTFAELRRIGMTDMEIDDLIARQVAKSDTIGNYVK
jgi:crotonobetainyl-CoA:carnitine CoA-transferase CaiB-like acyl-CoA transferase